MFWGKLFQILCSPFWTLNSVKQCIHVWPVQLLWRIRELESLQCPPWNEISPKGHLSPTKWICRGCSVLYSGSKQIINTWYSKKLHGIMQCVVSTSSSLPRPASLLYSILKGYIKAQILLVAAAKLTCIQWADSSCCTVAPSAPAPPGTWTMGAGSRPRPSSRPSADMQAVFDNIVE